jgi:hypothetical protein
MILKVHVPGALPYDIGDEIWHGSLREAIYAEAETIAAYAGADLLESPDRAHRGALRDRIVHEMTSALVGVGDHYRAPDGVLYSLIEEPDVDPLGGEDRLSAVSSHALEPVVDEVVRFEGLPLGSAGTRRAIVRWSDGTEFAAMTWYADEILSPVDRVEAALKRAERGELRVMSMFMTSKPSTGLMSGGPS